MIGYGQDAASRCNFSTSDAKAPFRRASNFPGESSKGSEAPAGLPDFDGAIGGAFLETCLEPDGEVHAEIIYK
jgi:hypothetical protein